MTDETSLQGRTLEHFRVAKRFQNRAFSTAEFKQLYAQCYPSRPKGSMIPSDFRVGGEVKGAEGYPRFLWQERRGLYRFTELHA
jgi:hypothetical protein